MRCVGIRGEGIGGGAIGPRPQPDFEIFSASARHQRHNSRKFCWFAAVLALLRASGSGLKYLAGLAVLCEIPVVLQSVVSPPSRRFKKGCAAAQLPEVPVHGALHDGWASEELRGSTWAHHAAGKAQLRSGDDIAAHPIQQRCTSSADTPQVLANCIYAPPFPPW